MNFFSDFVRTCVHTLHFHCIAVECTAYYNKQNVVLYATEDSAMVNEYENLQVQIPSNTVSIKFGVFFLSRLNTTYGSIKLSIKSFSIEFSITCEG